MPPTRGPEDVSQELAKLKHEKKNQNLQHLPSTAKIQRRPLNHEPVASPFAGSKVQKVVYVSRRTPVMSAVKRVKRFLRHIESRAHQSVDMLGGDDRAVLNELADISGKLEKSSEEVVVKASGRAMEQAMRVGKWFQTRENEILCKVDIRTGSVAAIDDIVEHGEDHDRDRSDEEDSGNEKATTLEGGDSTMELLDDLTTRIPGSSENVDSVHVPESKDQIIDKDTEGKRKRRRRKRPTYDKDDLPEARLRWVKTVEVAISLRA